MSSVGLCWRDTVLKRKQRKRETAIKAGFDSEEVESVNPQLES